MECYIYGSKSYAKLIAQIALSRKYQITKFIDDSSVDQSMHYLENRDSILSKKTPVFLGIGYKDLAARANLLKKLIDDGVHLPNLKHDSALIHETASIGVGNVIMAGAFIDAFSTIGNGNVFWPQSMVNHDAQVGNNCFFSPKSMTLGFSKVSDDCFIGAGAIVIDKTTVPPKTFIKANATFYLK